MVDRGDLGTHTFEIHVKRINMSRHGSEKAGRKSTSRAQTERISPVDLSASLPLVKSYLESGKENAPADALG